MISSLSIIFVIGLFKIVLSEKNEEIQNNQYTSLDNNENERTGLKSNLENFLRDEEIFNEKCSLLKCESKCCVGSLEDMKCANIEESCKNVIHKAKNGNVEILYISLLGVLGLLLLVRLIAFFIRKKYPVLSSVIAKIIMIIFMTFTFPISVPIYIIVTKTHIQKITPPKKKMASSPEIDPKEIDHDNTKYTPNPEKEISLQISPKSEVKENVEYNVILETESKLNTQESQSIQQL